ncbi:uncharacterized protein LOC117805780 isoform X2 [Xyrichtys novacula]|uniref:Uncharacterized protein LOC117805780 isoform X2 n=1 Tax=Xyrichtys novacula TaxID=13765 RepID=A0AAV1GPN1_XYRNO|nr:uncharacterized protein LOC117805780 isoform X2 [Xyrichtys novacula]
MKKQVTFSESQTVHRLHQDEAFPRSFETTGPKTGGVNLNCDLKIQPQAKRQLQEAPAIQIPKTMTAAPFLKHAALTPAQKKYLYTIAASYSTAHVRNVINQHYMNVLHRCIQAGQSPGRGVLVESPSVDISGSDKPRSGAPSQSKLKEKIDRGAKALGKPTLLMNQSRHLRRQDHSVAAPEEKE